MTTEREELARDIPQCVWHFDDNDFYLLGWGNASLRGPATVLFEGRK